MNALNSTNRILIISPVRNEEQYLLKTIESMLLQSIRPTLWIIVDDGSSDDTYKIAKSAAQNHEWIMVRSRKDRGCRKVGGGEVEAFYDGLQQVKHERFDFIMKLDGDIVLKPRHLEELLNRFRDDPNLGIASGWIKREKPKMFAPVGPAKVYRFSCFQQIGGLVSTIGWDGIDSYEAMKNGWETQVFWGNDLEIDHLRKMGSSQKGLLHGRFRDGQACYNGCYHPVYFMARIIKLCMHYPYFVGGAAGLWGYIESWLTRKPRHGDAEFRKFVRRFQVRLLLKAFINPFSNKR